ncbi:DUF6289 family protein [Lysobacter sp. CA196]|uniref:DUF6289 family protein n=1 Tax=Lysobacter sp. CA196 TaxID=3455606 RepID=UPI003F8D8159
MRKSFALGLGLVAALVATVALARPPGPDEIGEFYVYFDAAGKVVGQAQLSCEGVYSESGVRTASYSAGHMVCNPR